MATRRRMQQVQAHQQQARDQRAGVHVADRAAELVGQHDQHQRGRDGLRQRARGGDGAGGDGAVVAVAQHDGQRDQAHRDHRRGHHAGGGRQQRARPGSPRAPGRRAPGRRPGPRFPAGPRPCRALEDDAHEGEERDRQQRVVLHDAEHAQRQGLEQVGGNSPASMPMKPNSSPVAARPKATGMPVSRKTKQAREHQRHEVLAMNSVQFGLPASWFSASAPVLRPAVLPRTFSLPRR
jgi:hypothetical protein